MRVGPLAGDGADKLIHSNRILSVDIENVQRSEVAEAKQDRLHGCEIIPPNQLHQLLREGLQKIASEMLAGWCEIHHILHEGQRVDRDNGAQ